MGITDAQKVKTGKFISGSWHCEYTDDKNRKRQIQLIIDESSLTINEGVENIFGGGEQYFADPHWFGDYLVFLDTLYFTRYADDDVMAFGKLKHPYDDVIWERRFSRLKGA